MLENLNPHVSPQIPSEFRAALEFDGTQGTATLPAGSSDWESFLVEQGFDPEQYEIVGAPRTSRWQKYDGDWLTSYRFNFRKRSELVADLPLLMSQAKKHVRAKTQTQKQDKALVIMLSDFQIGKVDSRGGMIEQLERIYTTNLNLAKKVKQERYKTIVIAELGDIVEGFSNKADMQQLATNSASIMQQVDISITLIWDLIKLLNPYCEELIYATVASNHCQNRINKQQVGMPGQDDWGVFIARQIDKLQKETESSVRVVIPQPSDESLSYDVFGDQFHILGLWHGHQSPRPEAVPDFWAKQAFGVQPIAAASIGLTGHFHHLRVQELGQHQNGGSRFWIQAKTMDNGSSWFRLNSGSESQPGVVCFELEKEKHFTGSVFVV